MQIQVSTDHNIRGNEHLTELVRSAVEASLGHFGEEITRVEVHIGDENGDKSHGDDKKCVVEARPAGMQPVAVTHLAATVEDAVDGALERLARLLGGRFERLHDPKGRVPLGEDTAV